MFESIFQSFVEKLSSNVLLVSIAGLTITTSGIAGAKLYTEYTAPSTPPAIEVTDASEKISQDLSNNAQDTQPENVSQDELDISESVTVSADEKNSFPTASFVPSTTKLIVNTSESLASCIVTIFGKNYDVHALRSTHPGGDVFVCDTDMTAAYQRAHGTNVGMLSKYLSDAAIGTSNSQTPANSVKSFEHEEEREDEEYEEEREKYYEEDEENEHEYAHEDFEQQEYED